ncbi:UvrD-helicase domain-containing protein, partial [Nesterenkonia massiliensis]|uniref:UvrD-helicase domain-containing protein n=1 Tax=Nesterenkonia massiliensis TaxID=1232429 RepID=UPI0011CCA360
MTEIPPVEDIAKQFASSLPASVELPAGCGKTELIAATAAHLVESGESLLVLTHTHAGVDALKRRMIKFGINANSVVVRTLDSWAFDLVRHFPLLAEIEVPESPDWTKSRDYHRAAARAIRSRAIARMIRASYAAILVDEYQDCDVSQHSFVKALRDIIPVGVLGDPLQSIFHFSDNRPVSWEMDVLHNFPALELPYLPRRWAETHPLLGQWLVGLRSLLKSGAAVQVADSPVAYVPQVDHTTAIKTCWEISRRDGSIAILGHFRPDCVDIASKLKGSFTVMEALDEKVVRTVADRIDTGRGVDVAVSILEFALQSSSGLAAHISPSHRSKLAANASFATRTPDRQATYTALRLVRDNPSPINVYTA